MYYHGSGHIGPFVHTSAMHGKFGRILPEKKCSFSVTLLWSPYVYSPRLLHKIDKIKMAGTSRDISSVMTSTANNYNTRLNSSVRIKIRIRTEVT